MADLAPALIGIAGVTIGGAIQWLANVRSQRVQYIVERAGEKQTYLLALLSATERLFSATERWVGWSTMHTNPGAREAVREQEEASLAWAAVHARRHAVLPEHLAAPVFTIETARDDAVRRVRAGEAVLPDEWTRDTQDEVMLIYQGVQLSLTELDTEVTLALNPWSWKTRRMAKENYRVAWQDIVDAIGELPSDHFEDGPASAWPTKRW